MKFDIEQYRRDFAKCSGVVLSVKSHQQWCNALTYYKLYVKKWDFFIEKLKLKEKIEIRKDFFKRRQILEGLL